MRKKILCVGLVCVDIISVVGKFPEEDTDERSLKYYWQRGGNASNTSSVLALLGASVDFMGVMIKDHHYGFLESDFKKYGISIENCVVLQNGTQTTPTAIVIINSENGSRTILSTSKSELTAEDFETVDLQQYSWIHFEGRPNCKEINKMMERVQDYNKSLFNGNKITISVEFEKPKRPLLGLLADKADVVFTSKDYAAYNGFFSKEDAVRGLINTIKDGGVVICAWSEDGAAAMDWGGNLFSSPAFPPEHLVETLSAGDTFIAAVIFALNNGKNLGKCIQFGCQIAGAKCGMKGNMDLKEYKYLYDYI